MGSDADYLIDEYINDKAKKYYTNGHIPEDEEEEIRDALVAVYVTFEHWMPEDDDNYAGYEDGQAMFIIDQDDGSLCNVDFFDRDYPQEVQDFVMEAAYKHIGATHDKYFNCCPTGGKW